MSFRLPVYKPVPPAQRRKCLPDATEQNPLVPAVPSSTARWAGEQQDWQHHKRRGDEGEKESSKKAHATVDAAKPCEDTEYYVDNRFEHSARPRPSTALALQG